MLYRLIEFATLNATHYGAGWGFVSANVDAPLIALVNAYCGNREWTFLNRGHHGRTLELVLFIVAFAGCIRGTSTQTTSYGAEP